MEKQHTVHLYPVLLVVPEPPGTRNDGVSPILHPPQVHQVSFIQIPTHPIASLRVKKNSPCCPRIKIISVITRFRASPEEDSSVGLVLHKGKLRHEACGSAPRASSPEFGLEAHGGFPDLPQEAAG